MTVQLEYETEKTLPIDCEKLAVSVAERVLEMEECPYEAEVSLVITDNEGIHQVNREFRNIDRPTDGLSFPAVPFETPCDYEILEEDDSYFDLDSGNLVLGDIMISSEKVVSQAEEYGHSITREFAFLVAHSILHLLGYDHMTPEEAEIMEQKQTQALHSLGIERN